MIKSSCIYSDFSYNKIHEFDSFTSQIPQSNFHIKSVTTAMAGVACIPGCEDDDDGDGIDNEMLNKPDAMIFHKHLLCLDL